MPLTAGQDHEVTSAEAHRAVPVGVQPALTLEDEMELATLAPPTSNPHGARSSDRQYTLLWTVSAVSSSVTASRGGVFNSCTGHSVNDWTTGPFSRP
jgi:hypothetical protein